MFAEELSIFFNDFGLPASWAPAAGGATQTAQVLLDQPDQDVFSGQQISTEYLITFAATDLVGLKHNEAITVGGIGYRVREVIKLDDGQLITAKLKKL